MLTTSVIDHFSLASLLVQRAPDQYRQTGYVVMTPYVPGMDPGFRKGDEPHDSDFSGLTQIQGVYCCMVHAICYNRLPISSH